MEVYSEWYVKREKGSSPSAENRGLEVELLSDVSPNGFIVFFSLISIHFL